MLKVFLNSCLLTAVCVLDANASNLMLESEINVRASYDDNVNVSTIDSQSASFYTVTPKMNLSYDSDNWETSMNARISGTKYSSVYQDQIDSTYLDIGTAYKDRRNIYSVTGSYSNTFSRSADQDIVYVNFEETDTKKLTLAPTYTRLLTERLSLALTYSSSDVSYSPNELGRYLPYETQTATAAMAYDLSQKSKLNLNIASTDYTSENNISEYQLLSSKVGINHSFSSLISAQFAIGANTRDFITRSSQNFAFAGSLVTGTQAVETNNSGVILEAGIDAKWINLQASRNTVSNSIGGLDETDRLSATLRMQVTPLIGISLSMERLRINELNDNIIDRSHISTKILPAMKFSLAHNLSLRAEYAFIDQKLVDVSQSSLKKNRFYLNLKYDFPSI